ncbi:MAG: Ig-like domain-containing protein, partial [Deltaproteobacteria bacterium]|nr:Ig-like domain-containing protein [Deltaproteobacteria bacterium]
QTQVGAFVAGDMVVTGCPAPTVVSAVAVASNMVQITFSRHIKASSVLPDGSQFTFDNGLMAMSASATGKVVTIVTSAQNPGAAYVATVANTVTDLQGTALGVPVTASFTGFQTLALVRINEVNANIANCDLIELRVISGGTMTGYKLQERDTANLVTFPAFTVATNDLIVVHMNNGATCNPGNSPNETTAANEQLQATHAANYDTAFDFYSTDTGLTSTDNVFTLYNNAGAIMDAIFASDDPAGATAATGTENQAALVGAAAQWSPMLATYIDTVFRTNAVDDLNATGTTAAGTSIQRVDNSDDNDKADWSTGAGPASTWGALNVGQTAF